MDMFSGPDERAGTGYGGNPSGYGAPQVSYGQDAGNSGSTSGFNWGDAISSVLGGAGGGRTGLLDIYGAYKGSQEARDEAFRLQNLYNDAQARRQPVLDRLNASYTDPNTFYDSNQWKGLSSVYQNSIDRQAAAKGRLANPTDREVMLQNYAMKELENYRGGLRQQAQILNPDNYINPFMRGSTREAGAANPWFAMGGRGGVGGPGLNGSDMYATLSKLAQSFGGFDKIPSFLRGMFDGSNPNYGSPDGGFESNFPEPEMPPTDMTGGMGWSNPDEYGYVQADPGAWENMDYNWFD